LRDSIAWIEVLHKLGVRGETAGRWADAFAKQVTPAAFSKGEAEIPEFLGQILHESAMLEHAEENLRYSAKRLTEVWPSRFKTLAQAQAYANNPPALANRVYGMRADLGNDQPGDGYKYRGRTFLQITGKANYRQTGQALKVDLVNNPDLLAQPEFALRAAIAWWERNIPDSLIGNVDAISRRVNGGTVGIAQREGLTNLAVSLLT
jgi:putative chitinase